jgi:hypothetical protein
VHSPTITVPARASWPFVVPLAELGVTCMLTASTEARTGSLAVPPYIRPHAALGPSLVHGAVRVERPPLGPCAATRGQSSTLTRQIPVQAVVRVNTAAALTAKDMSSARFSTSGPFPPPSRCRLRRRGRSRRTIRGMGGADEQPIPDYFVIG